MRTMLLVTWLLTSVCFVAASPSKIRNADSVKVQGDNILFNKWRPISRFIAPAGWMNDPCGAVRDSPHLGLFFQQILTEI